jgi:hypothetical protein
MKRTLQSPPLYGLVEASISGAVWAGISKFLKWNDVKLTPGQQESLHEQVERYVMNALVEDGFIPE